MRGRRLPLLAAGLLVLLACGSKSGTGNGTQATSGPDGGPLTTGPGGTNTLPDGGPLMGDTAPGGSPVPYNLAVMKGVHNAYDRDEPLIDMLLFHDVRSVELDIHKGKGADAPPGQWWVYHVDIPTQDGSSCTMLADCLGLLRAFHDALPLHEVITVYVDLKDDFVDGHQPADLDNAITSVIGRENIVTPADLIGKCNGATTVRAAVAKPCGFPTLASLRGKFMFTATTGSLCDASSHVAHYGGTTPRQRLIFLAPDLTDDCDSSQYDGFHDVVFQNMSLADKDQAAATKTKGLVGRMYSGDALNGGLDSEDDWNTAKAAGIEQLATDEVNVSQDPWSTTTGPKGFPFQCDGCDALGETGNVLSLSAASGDQWDVADSGFYATETDGGASTWSAMIGVPSSHTEEFAKACLVARASDDPGAANVAFCRPFDDNPPRLQIRPTAGADTTTQDAPTFDGLVAETGIYMRLVFTPDAAKTTVTASVSRDGKQWNDFQTTPVVGTLPLRGVSLSSHGSGQQRAVFAALTKAAPDLPPETITASKLTAKPISADATGGAFDGIVPP